MNSKTFIKQDALKKLVKRYDSKSVATKIEASLTNNQLIYVETNKLVLFPLFNEKNYTNKSLNSLTYSLSKDGFMIPIFIYDIEDKLYVVNGVKRFLVSKKENILKLPCVILNCSFEELICYTLNNMISNKDNSLILAYAYNVLINEYNMTEKDIRELTHYSHGQICNLLRLLKLSNNVKNMILNDEITYIKARMLISLKENEQEYVASIIKNMSVREGEDYIKKYKSLSEQEKKQLINKPYDILISDNKIVIEINDKTYQEKILNKLKEVK